MELQNYLGPIFKVTRRIPEFSIAETRVFRSKDKAIALFEEWLKEPSHLFF